MNPRRKDSRTLVFGATLCGEAPPEALRLDVVDEPSLAVDLHDREQLAVAGLELGVAGDVHLAEVEVELLAQRGELRPRPLAEVAPLRVVEHDVGPGTVPTVTAGRVGRSRRGLSPHGLRVQPARDRRLGDALDGESVCRDAHARRLAV